MTNKPKDGGPALRMDAYYYGFEPTGVREIDLILSAVACAGKAYHHTESWNERDESHEPSPVDRIQDAANAAARAMLREELSRLRAENERLKVIAGSDPTTATRDDLRRWTAQQHDEIRDLRAQLSTIRSETLEEAAKVVGEPTCYECDHVACAARWESAAAIRARASPAPEERKREAALARLEALPKMPGSVMLPGGADDFHVATPPPPEGKGEKE